MLKNLSLKTKLWIFISSAVLLVLVIMSAAIFGKGTLFQGFIFNPQLSPQQNAISDSSAPATPLENKSESETTKVGLKITRVAFTQHAFKAPTANYVTIYTFKIKNERNAAYKISKLNIKFNFQAGGETIRAQTAFRSNTENLQLSLAGDACTDVINQRNLSATNLIAFSSPFGTGSACYPLGISLAAGAEKTFIVQAKFRSGANAVFYPEINELQYISDNQPENLPVTDTSQLTGPSINISPNGFHIQKRDDLVSTRNFSSSTDRYIPIMKIELTNYTLGTLGIKDMRFGMVFLDREDALRPYLENFKLYLPNQFGCMDAHANDQLSSANTLLFRANEFRGVEEENCEFDEEFDFSPGESAVLTLSAKLRTGAKGQFFASIVNASDIETKYGDGANIFVLQNTPLNGPTITIVPIRTTASQEETAEDAFVDVGEAEPSAGINQALHDNNDEEAVNPPGSGTAVTARSETITPTPSLTIYRNTEIEVLRFNLESSNTVDLNTITFHLTPGTDTTLPRTHFQEFKLMRENATLITSSGNQLSNFRNIGDLTLAIPAIGRNLSATQRKTYSLFAKLTTDAPFGNSFKIQLDGIQTSPAVTLNGAPVVSTKFTVEAQQTSGSGTTMTGGTTAQEQRIEELQQQISLIQQQLMQALQSQDASAASEIAETLETLIAAQNQITENQRASSQQRIIGTDPLLGLEDTTQEEEVEALRETPPPPPPQPQPQSFTPPPITVDSGQVRGVAATDSTYGALEQPTLVSTPRIRTAPERGDTGPEVLIYIGVLVASQGIYIWRKRKVVS